MFNGFSICKQKRSFILIFESENDLESISFVFNESHKFIMKIIFACQPERHLTEMKVFTSNFLFWNSFGLEYIGIFSHHKGIVMGNVHIRQLWKNVNSVYAASVITRWMQKYIEWAKCSLFEVTTFTEFQICHHHHHHRGSRRRRLRPHSPYISNSCKLSTWMTNIVPYRFDGLVNFQCTYYFTLTLVSFTLSSFSLCCFARALRIYVNYEQSFWLCKKKEAKNLNDVDYVIVMWRYKPPISYFLTENHEDKKVFEVIHIEQKTHWLAMYVPW